MRHSYQTFKSRWALCIAMASPSLHVSEMIIVFTNLSWIAMAHVHECNSCMILFLHACMIDKSNMSMHGFDTWHHQVHMDLEWCLHWQLVLDCKNSC